MGAIGAPFGVRGWVKLRSDTDPPERLLDYGVWNVSVGNGHREYELDRHGRTSGQLTAKLRGVDDRDAAAALTGAAILVPRSQLPPTASNEFYRSDLIGCIVESLAGHRFGTIAHFVETPANALMVVIGAGDFGKTETWIPAGREHIRRVDLQARKVVVDWDETLEVK